MIPWQRLASSPLPAVSPRGPRPGELVLWKRGADELVLRVGHHELMSSRQHHSEDELGRLACAHLGRGQVAKILIGGLGMGFTLRAVLDAVGPKAQVEVAELVPAVVEWNRGLLGPLANHPLNDKRVRLFEGDVWARITSGADYDAILLDVDNGPVAMTAADNSRLYDYRGLEMIRAALRPGGVLAVWSAADDPRFSKRFKNSGFDVLRHHVRARPEAGATHVLSIGTKQAPQRPMRPEAAQPMSRREERAARNGRGPGGERDARGGERGRAMPAERGAAGPRAFGPRGFDGRSGARGAVASRRPGLDEGAGRDERGGVARAPSGGRPGGGPSQGGRPSGGRPGSGPSQGGRPGGGRPGGPASSGGRRGR